VEVRSGEDQLVSAVFFQVEFNSLVHWKQIDDCFFLSVVTFSVTAVRSEVTTTVRCLLWYVWLVARRLRPSTLVGWRAVKMPFPSTFTLFVNFWKSTIVDVGTGRQFDGRVLVDVRRDAKCYSNTEGCNVFRDILKCFVLSQSLAVFVLGGENTREVLTRWFRSVVRLLVWTPTG
jgi:hypothetical protein